jgi:predicted acetyltransferase
MKIKFSNLGTLKNLLLRFALFWDITQRLVVVMYRRFGTTYLSHLQETRSPRTKLSSWTSWPSNMGPIGCPETSEQSYHSALLNIPEELRSHLHRAGSLKSRKNIIFQTNFLVSQYNIVFRKNKTTVFS